MNCREAQIDIALLVGNDLEDADAREHLRQHMTSCPDCRQHYRNLKSTLPVLGQSEREPTYEVRESLWPAVSQRLQRRQQDAGQLNPRKWWLPGIFLAACVMLVVMIQPPLQHHANQLHQDKGLLPSLPVVEPHTAPSVPAETQPKPKLESIK